MANQKGFAEVSKAAQEEMSKWDPQRRDAVQLQGKLNYQRAVEPSNMPSSLERTPPVDRKRK